MDIVLVAGIIIIAVTGIPVVLQLRQHPKGLFILFLAEMWERFSYYGMRGLLIFYLTQHFLFDDKAAQGQYGAYTSLVYLIPLIGGYLADKWLGSRKAIAFGALLLVAGHLAMAIEGPPATQTLSFHGATYDFQSTGRGDDRKVELVVGGKAYGYGPAAGGGLEIRGLPADAPLPATLPAGDYQLGVKPAPAIFKDILFLALALIIMGVGYLKANISSIVGQLYPQGDPRRDPGFTLYYYGINLGSFLAAYGCGALGQKVGWAWGFGAAGIGMALGWLVFIWGKPLLEGKGEPPEPATLKKKVAGPINLEWLLYLAAIPGVAIIWVLVQYNGMVGWMLGAGSIIVVGYLFWVMFTQCGKEERERLGLALVLILGSVVFWTLFEQAGSSLNQYAERNTDLRVGFGQSMTAAQTQMFNAGWILILAPVFSAIWAWLGRRSRDPNPMIKFGLALVQVGAGFFILVFGAQFAGPDYKVPLVFLLLAYLLHTTGELCLSPVGMAQMTKLSPLKVVSTVMATWFLASSWAQWIGGIIAGFTAAETVGGQVLDPGKALATYNDVFLKIGIAGVATGVLFLILSPWLKTWAHGASDTHALPQAEVDGDRQSVDRKALP